MTPTQRKQNSELTLAKYLVPINPTLPSIESEEDTRLRTPDELLRRFVALWAVTGAAFRPEKSHFRDFINEHGFTNWLSTEERAFLFALRPSKQQLIRFSWQLESLYFLAWCAGLVSELEVPTKESSPAAFSHLFPRSRDDLARIESAIVIRPIGEILNWSDLIYRLHWAVRDASLRATTSPSQIKAGVVQEWHRAANWMTCYEDQEDWDQVATDT